MAWLRHVPHPHARQVLGYGPYLPRTPLNTWNGRKPSRIYGTSTSAPRKVDALLCLLWANLLPDLWIVHFRFAEGRRSRSAQVPWSQESGRNLGNIEITPPPPSVFVCTCVCVWLFVCMYVCMCVYVCICMCVYVCICICVYVRGCA